MKLKSHFVALLPIVAIALLATGCTHLEKTPVVTVPNYPVANKIPLNVGLVMTPEYRQTKWEFHFGIDTWLFPIGDNLTVNSEDMARKLFTSVKVMDAPVAPADGTVNAFLIPQVKAFEGSSGSFAWSEAVRTLIVEWSLKDVKNNVIWVDSIRADAKGHLGTAFNATSNDEELVGEAIQQLFLKSYQEISTAPQIRKFATGK